MVRNGPHLTQLRRTELEQNQIVESSFPTMLLRPPTASLLINTAVAGRRAALPLVARSFSAAVADGELYPMPAAKPCPDFSSGPCKKRPGWSTDIYKTAAMGRSHRSKVGKAKLQKAIDDTRRILSVPDDYRIGIVPASDTGAIEMAMWSMLGERPVRASLLLPFSSSPRSLSAPPPPFVSLGPRPTLPPTLLPLSSPGCGRALTSLSLAL